ncbi:serine/threonine-protein kinase [Gordonia soli]|uniref:non-specific serine/threonine protein kinase n=1 Tax=Gordonia soli NBRC 108243 TaxID=1223545 RepID=M0QGN6_9ACTN|nr:serine/threonine-protein kinase [Gordonia soli]GAC67451.1 putative serine/threonine protein kinase [Gordonia soli NBRC 108243]
MFSPGEVVAGHIVDDHLGGGSSADVYRVHLADGPGPDEQTPRALKVLHPESADAERARDRFEREFYLASLLHHRHIVEVFDRGEVIPSHPDDVATLWMSMEYVDGPPATELIPAKADEPDVATIVTVARQIADALDHAHRHDVLHRDVKPANILVAASAEGADAALGDFGIAQLLDDTRPLARNGRVEGSIAYAAPELLQAQQLSGATDQYALACSLFELLTGRVPFPRATPFAITYAHIHDDIPRLSRVRSWLPSGLDSVFAKAMAKGPDRRYPTCTEFTDIVGRTLRGVPVPPPVERPRRWGIRRNAR